VMQKLIEALQIFLKYGNPTHPTHCEHDELTVAIDPSIVSAQDKVLLDDLGFIANDDEEHFTSYKYGSC